MPKFKNQILDDEKIQKAYKNPKLYSKNFLSDLVKIGQPFGVDDSVMIIQRKLNLTLL